MVIERNIFERVEMQFIDHIDRPAIDLIRGSTFWYFVKDYFVRKNQEKNRILACRPINFIRDLAKKRQATRT